jgi:sulfhydrogenase subunit alpha
VTHSPKGGNTVLKVGALARVEGEGAMSVHIADGQVTEVQLQIYEPPRYFEAFLRGRSYLEPPDITARICGICPVAYQMSACRAIEDALGVLVPDHIAALRRLLYCGEWIESHALHIYLLHAPDFLGYPGAVEMAADYPDLVQRGLRLKQAGNTILTTLGGRSIHPVNVRVGGFYRLPGPAELKALRTKLDLALADALATVADVSGFDFPDLEHRHVYLALRPEKGYPLEAGDVVTSAGDHFAVADYLNWVTEEHVPHSTALHAHLRGQETFLVGPLARYTLNYDRLTPQARVAADNAGLGSECRNPFRSIVVRAVEIVVACEEALRIIDEWSGDGEAAVAVNPAAGASNKHSGTIGHGAT